MSQQSKRAIISAGAEGPHSINTLPEEILVKIFGHLTQKVLQPRLVCKRWNEIIKENFNFAVKLNEDSPEILQLRISELKVVKLVKAQIQILPDEVDSTKGQKLPSGKAEETKLIFKYPNKIQRIEIGYCSKISPINVKGLLELCQKSLTNLKLTVGPESWNWKHQFSYRSSFQFEGLTQLDLTINLKYRDDLLRKNTILDQLGNSRFPKLGSFKVTLNDFDECERGFSATALLFVLKLLAKGPMGLSRLHISFIEMFCERGSSKPSKKLTAAELSSLESMTDLKHLTLELRCRCSIEDSTLTSRLLELISRQKKLETLKADFEVKGSLLRSIIPNNQETIVEINIDRLNVNKEHPFDASVFKYCHKLTKLELAASTFYHSMMAGHNTCRSGPVLTKTGSFPAAIQSLSLRGFWILSRDIVSLLNSDLKLTLEELHLQECGNSDACGINYDVLENVEGFLKAEKLQKMFLYSSNSWGSEEEKQKMGIILTRLGNRTQHACTVTLLSFVRDSDNRMVREK